MINLRICAVCAVVLCTMALPVSAAKTDGPGQRNADWIEDIEYLHARLLVMHPNLYAYNSEEEFSAAVEDLERRVPKLTDNEIVLGIHELMALVRDAHTSAAPWNPGSCALTDAWNAYPLSFHHFADGMYVLAAAEQHRDLVGKRIVKFGAVDPDVAVERTGCLVGADNAQGRLQGGCIYLMVDEALEYCGITPERGKLRLTLADAAGRETEHTLAAEPWPVALQSFYQIGSLPDGRAVMNDEAAAPLPLYLSCPGDSYWFEYLPEHETMYVCLLSMVPKQEEDFAAFYARMFREFDRKKAKNLVLDVRNNGGGDHYEMPLLKGVIARPQLDDREHLFVITGQSVVSASQHFVTQFMMYTEATFVGEPTSAKPNFFGAQRFFELPNSRLRVRTSVIFHQDATGWEMAGTSQPDYLVRLSGADFAANWDPVMAMILDFDRYAGLPAEFEKKLGDAYAAGGISALQEACDEFMRVHRDSYLNDYSLFGDFIWWMFDNRKSLEDYGEFLEMYARRCPDSSGAWYSLGMRHKNAGDQDAALRCLELSIEAYPGNEPAKMQRDLILFEREWAQR